MEFYSNSKDIVFTSPLPNIQLLKELKCGPKVLEIGSGYSRILRYLYDNGYTNLSGIECSTLLLERAKEILPEAKYYCCNAIDFKTEEKYDLILVCGVLEYFIGADRYKLFNCIDNLLSNQGLLYLEIFTYDYSCIKCYIKGFCKTGQTGAILLTNNMVLQHTSTRSVINQFKRIGNYSVCYVQKEKFKTWTNASAPGAIIVLRKNGIK